MEPPTATASAIDLSSASANAMANRTSLEIARNQLRSSDVSLRLADEERKPGVDLTVHYGATGLAGTQVLRGANELGSTVIGNIPGTYADALSSLAGMNYPTWSVALNFTLPIGNATRAPPSTPVVWSKNVGPICALRRSNCRSLPT